MIRTVHNVQTSIYQFTLLLLVLLFLMTRIIHNYVLYIDIKYLQESMELNAVWLSRRSESCSFLWLTIPPAQVHISFFTHCIPHRRVFISFLFNFIFVLFSSLRLSCLVLLYLYSSSRFSLSFFNFFFHFFFLTSTRFAGIRKRVSVNRKRSTIYWVAIQHSLGSLGSRRACTSQS